MLSLADLPAQHAELRAELDRAVARVIAACQFAGGPETAAFESEYAAWIGAEHCVGVGSGTAALSIALAAAGIGPGDEVILPGMSFIATIAAVLQVGAQPVLVDVDHATALAAPEAMAAAVGPRSAALLPVHLYGQAVDLAGFRALADRAGLFLLEDAAQAQGATAGGLRAGAVGDAAATSFYPGKNLGAWGEAGAITCADPALASRMRRLREHGLDGDGRHLLIGANERMDGIQAAVLRVKLRRLEAWNAQRRTIAQRYDAALAGGPTDPVREADGRASVYHHYVVRPADREGLRARLAAAGIGTGSHYPLALHEHEAVVGRFRAAGPLPEAELIARRGLSIPVHQHLSDPDVERVIAALRDA